jgi:DNA-binding protein H-NS
MATYTEIQEQIKKLQEQADKIRAGEIESVIADLRSKIAHYGLSAEQLGFTSSAKKTGTKASAATVMYRKGNLTWSGAARGRRPDWVKEILDAGGDLQQYRVK